MVTIYILTFNRGFISYSKPGERKTLFYKSLKDLYFNLTNLQVVSRKHSPLLVGDWLVESANKMVSRIVSFPSIAL